MTIFNKTANCSPITIFFISWGRPLYLWQSLDALWRYTQTAARVVLLDNAHPDPLVGEVINAFERRGLFSEIIRFPTNNISNITSAYKERLKEAGPLHVYLESDAVICESSYCWLYEMRRIMEENPNIGMLGSLIDDRDFVDPEVALKLTGGDAVAAEFLAKLCSVERKFINAPRWADTSRDFFFTEPPCPIGNPPGRLMMLRTDIIRENGFQIDSILAESFKARGMKTAVTAKVRHRHLSLLNIYDYNDYSREQRNDFFGQ